MMWSDEQIESYIFDRLAPEERSEMDRQLSIDADLRSRVETMQHLVGGVRRAFNRELKRRLQDDERHFADANARLLTGRWLPGKVALIAASISIVIAAVVWLVRSPSGDGSLYKAYYEPYPNVVQPVTRSSGEGRDGFALYERGQYEAAIPLLVQAKTQDVYSPPVLDFYIGLCHMEMERFDSAVKSFDAVIGSDHASFVRPARWYRVLALLADDQSSTATEALETLAVGDDVYAHKARSLLSDLP